MFILTRKQEFLQQCVPHIPAKVSNLFTFGFETLVATDIRSARSNARRSRFCWATAKGKMGRVLGNRSLTACFPRLLTACALVSDDDVVAVDFSEFKDGRQVLMFAKETRKGRALPLYFEILKYPIQKNSQNTFVIKTIEQFFRYAHCQPLLVFDRGFACPAIIKYMVKNRHRFIVRIKKRKHLVSADGIKRAAEAFDMNDERVTAYDRQLRLVVSDRPGNNNDPWYLLTNDTGVSRIEIISRYRQRFEIEEFFRDAKRLLGLEWVRPKTVQSLTVLLWFVLLTAWLFTSIAAGLTKHEESERECWRVSRFRYVFEKLQQELLRLADPSSGTRGFDVVISEV